MKIKKVVDYKDLRDYARMYASYYDDEITSDIAYSVRYKVGFFEEDMDNIFLGHYEDDSREILKYFKGTDPTKEEVMLLAKQFATLTKEYGKQILSGEDDISKLETKITINGTDVSYNDLNVMKETLAKIDNLDTKKNLKFDSFTAYALIGVKVAEVNYAAKNNLSSDAAKLFIDTYAKRVSNTIESNDKRIIDSLNAFGRQEYAKTLISKYGNYSGIDKYRNFGYSDLFTNSWKEDIYSAFANIDVSSRENFEASFDNSIKEFEKIQSFLSNMHGNSTTPQNKQSLEELKGLKDILI